VACTGDVIQQWGDALSLQWAMCNDSPAGTDDGIIFTLRQMSERQVDINLGGHGSRFTNCAELYRESLARCRQALPVLSALVPNGDLTRASRRPHYPTFATRD
jgi:hypothetical protein